MGYHRAGFDVVGVDIEPQPHYPFEFHQADAIAVLDRLIVPADDDPADWLSEAGFDAIHASPTCQHHARVTAWRGDRDDYPDLLTPTLTRLAALRIPWVVENVPETVGILRPDYRLCGTQFGLDVRRHRIFQRGNWDAYELLPACQCYRNRRLLPFEHKGERAFADAMDCGWMSSVEARQAIPPAFIGGQLIGCLTEAAA